MPHYDPPTTSCRILLRGLWQWQHQRGFENVFPLQFCKINKFQCDQKNHGILAPKPSIEKRVYSFVHGANLVSKCHIMQLSDQWKHSYRLFVLHCSVYGYLETEEDLSNKMPGSTWIHFFLQIYQTVSTESLSELWKCRKKDNKNKTQIRYVSMYWLERIN